MANVIQLKRYDTIVDLTNGVMDLSKDIETNYYYEVETLDGNKHYSVRSVFSVYDIVLGDRVENGTSYVEKFNIFYSAYMTDTTIPIYCRFTDNGDWTECQIEKGTCSANSMRYSWFWWDSLPVKIKVLKDRVSV